MNENTTADYKTFCEIKVNENKPSVKAVLELGQNIINELLKENAELKARADNRLKHWSVLQEENAELKERLKLANEMPYTFCKQVANEKITKENAELKAQNENQSNLIQGLFATNKKANAQIEKMKCCGNCKHNTEKGTDTLCVNCNENVPYGWELAE